MELVYRPLSDPPGDSIDLYQDDSRVDGDFATNILGGNDSISLRPGFGAESTFSLFTESGEAAIAEMNLGTGEDSVLVQQGALIGDLRMGDDVDTVTQGGGAMELVFGGDGNDRFVIRGGTIGSDSEDGGLFGDAGNDTFTVTGGTVFGQISGGEGADTISFGVAPDEGLAGGAGDGGPGQQVPAVGIFGDGGNDTITIGGGGINGNVGGDAGNDGITMTGGTVGALPGESEAGFGELHGGDGDDAIAVSGGSVGFGVFGDAGTDRVTISGTADVGSQVRGGGGDDILAVEGGSVGSGAEGDGVFNDAGDDSFTLSGGAIDGDVAGGDGADAMTLSGGTVEGEVLGGAGNDSIAMTGGSVAGGLGALHGDDGNDTLSLAGGEVFQLFGDTGDDTIAIAGGSASAVSGDAGADAISVSGAADIGAIVGGDGDDRIAIADGTIDDVSGNAGNDTIEMTGGAVVGNGDSSFGAIHGNADDDAIEVSGGSIGFGVFGDAGTDNLTIAGTADVASQVRGGDGDDALAVEGGSVGSGGEGDGVYGDDGADGFTLTGGLVDGLVSGGEGNDTFALSGGRVNGSLSGDAGDDTATLSAGRIASAPGRVSGALDGGDGDDRLFVLGTAEVDGRVSGGAGDDMISVAGGTIGAGLPGDGVFGDAGTDSVTQTDGLVRGDMDAETVEVSGGTLAGGLFATSATVNGGTVEGDITAPSITLSGGAVEGNLLGITGDTLTINGPVTLSPGARVSGFDATGLISGATLPSLSFEGFDTLTLTGSTLGLDAGVQGIALLVASEGSLLQLERGPTSLDTGDGRGRLDFTGSTIDMRNGVAGDVLRVSRARLDTSTLGLDVDLAGEVSDRIDANAVIVEGRNTLALVMLDDAVPSGTRLFAILPVEGEVRPLPGGSPNDAFVVDALAFPLVGQVLTGSEGGLYLQVSPDSEVLVPGVPVSPSNASGAAAFLTTIDDFSSQTLNDFLDQATVSRTGGQISETFGVFAFGRAGYLDHDGFEVSGPGGTEAGAPFSANDFSLIGSVEVDVAKWRDLPDYLLKVGLFGGYASTEVDVDGTTVDGVPLRGSSGENESGMFGGYVVLARGQNYGLASLTGFWGKSDVTNDDLDSTGSYDTSGYGLTLTAGRQTPLNERYTFDLRGSVGYLSFTGDGFTDSQGFEYGESEVSFGFVKLQPGISAAVPFRDQTLRPYLRAELAQRIDYQNTSSFQGEDFNFQDNDFSAAAMLGTDYAVRDNLTLSGEVAGYTSGDFNAVTAKIGLKYLF